MEEFSVTEYAKSKTITRQAVLAQINEHRLPENTTAKMIGNTWVISVERKMKNSKKKSFH